MPAPIPVPRSSEEIAEDDYWFALFGDWDALDPEGVRDFFDGFERPWWIVGGWSIEAFTGEQREHEDLDVSILACDVPALREHVRGRWHLWSVAKQALSPLTDLHPDVERPDSQLWVRRDARSPWALDIPLTPDSDGRWTNKRIPADVRDVADATWVAPDGLAYLRPEITLLFKARLDRTKDRHDLDVTWPLLAAPARAWLVDAIASRDAHHPWLPRLV